MKIGIITFWTSKDNYGQLLQCFALQQYLRKNGHEPFLIRYKESSREEASFKFSNLLKYILRFPQYLSWYLNEKRIQRNANKYNKQVASVNRYFDVFIREYITTSKHIYTDENIYKTPPVADAYICGSDQVWGGDWVYYLDFAFDNKPKIAYAPSLGGLSSFSHDYEEKLRKLLQRFAFIGMREQSGVDVCHRLGRKDAVKVVDPTLLLTQEDYNKIRINTKQQGDKPYLFAYILGNPMTCEIEDVYEYARKRGLEVKYTTSGKADDYEHIYPQIGEWIDLIANADVIVTNSFHGTVFCLIYNKPFITIPLKSGYERMNTRVTELLEAVGLKNRIYNGNLYKISSSVDFTAFNNYRYQEEQKSASYLFNNLIKSL